MALSLGNNKYTLANFRGDIIGGITTVVIVYPAALAFGVASGLGPIAGLYCVVAVAFFAAAFGGTPAMYSGPTAPMTVAMAVIVSTSSHNLTEAFATVCLAGIFQIIFGVMRLGRFIAYTPHSVISGYMTGIGVIVISINILPLMGLTKVTTDSIAQISSIPIMLTMINLEALCVGVITLGVLVFWPRRIQKIIPSILAGLVIGTLLVFYYFKNTPVIGTLESSMFTVTVPFPGIENLFHVIETAFILAIIGSLNSLLTSLVVESMTSKVHNPNKELVGQGLGNLAAGMIGGIPGSASPYTTVANLRSGGNTRLSAIIVAVAMFFVVSGYGDLTEYIPYTVLSAILIKLGWSIIDFRLLRNIAKLERSQAIVMLLTVFLVVFVDVISGVAIGLIISGFAAKAQTELVELDNVMSVPLIDMDADDNYTARTGLVRLVGTFSVASASSLVRVINADIKDHEVVIFDFEPTTYLDDSAAIIIGRLIESAIQQNTPCLVVGLSQPIKRELDGFQALELVPEDLRFDTLDQARTKANELLKETDAG